MLTSRLSLSAILARPAIWIKIALFYLTLLLTASLISSLAGEAFLRVFWRNPYSVQPIALDYPGLVRLQLPNVDVQYDVNGLYPDRSIVRFRTEEDGRIHRVKPSLGPVVYFYGGSTTENRYIPEGSRWPELITRIDGRNWGVSGNHLLDSSLNFQFHLERMPPPDYVVFMHAVNDFSARNVFELDRYVETMGQSRRSNRPVGERFYLFDFGRNFYEIWFNVSSVKEKIRQSVIATKSRGDALDEKGYREFIESSIAPFLDNRTKVLNNIAKLTESKSVKMVLVTQPHAYGSNFIPQPGEDLRDLPVIDGGKYLNHAQIGAILDLINENTRNFAKSYGVPLIDVSRAFDALDVSELFYDGVHYTEKGSLTFGRIVNSVAPW